MGEKNEEKNLTPHRRGWGWVQKKIKKKSSNVRKGKKNEKFTAPYDVASRPPTR